MTSGNPRRDQRNSHIRVAAENVRPLVEPDAAIRPFQEERDLARATGTRASFGARYRFTKRIAKPVYGPNEPRVRGIVTDCSTNLADQVREILLDYESGGPQPLLQVALGHRLRSVGDQQAQKLECFGRESDRDVLAHQFTGFRVENERAEAH